MPEHNKIHLRFMKLKREMLLRKIKKPHLLSLKKDKEGITE